MPKTTNSRERKKEKGKTDKKSCYNSKTVRLKESLMVKKCLKSVFIKVYD